MGAFSAVPLGGSEIAYHCNNWMKQSREQYVGEEGLVPNGTPPHTHTLCAMYEYVPGTRTSRSILGNKTELALLLLPLLRGGSRDVTGGIPGK